jgi:hypothetical protein
MNTEDMVMGSAVRLVRQAQIAMLVSIALYAVAGETLGHKLARGPEHELFHVLSLISIILVGAMVVLRRTLVLPAEAALQESSDDRAAVGRWRTGYLFLYVLCDMLGLFGLILRMDGFAFTNIWGFYLSGFLLLSMYSPRLYKKKIVNRSTDRQ